MRRKPFTVIAAALIGMGIALSQSSCSDNTPSPTSPSAVALAPSVNEPEVLVGGVLIRGHVAEGTGRPTLFQVHVQAPGGLNTVQRVIMEYAQPGSNHHGGPMMNGFTGTVLCYDDGTHGDDIPGDGIYHFMDPGGTIGCHGLDAPSGEYHYSFWCEDLYGRRSNTASLTIIRD